MNLTKTLALAAVVVAGLAGSVQAGEWAQVGVLTCTTSPSIGLVVGSQRHGECTFKSADGDVTHYSVEINRLGLDLGFTATQTLIWGVFAAGDEPGNLEGVYVGTTGEASVGLGGNLNALYGGFKDSYALQPLSGGVTAGLNFALVGTSLELTAR